MKISTNTKARVNTGYENITKTVPVREIKIKEFPNNRFLVGPSYSPVNGELETYQLAIYEYSSGWVVGRGKTVEVAKLDAVDRINRYGGETGLVKATKGKKQLNKG